MWNILTEMWDLTAAMAPYLLLGFVLAGVLGELVPRTWIQRHLSGGGLGPIIKGVLFGAPLPICSCGVIPLAAGLRKQGASRGATAAFVATTPQTGVDSIAATYSLMGWPFTLARLGATVVSGLLAGSLINVFARKPRSPEANDSGCGGEAPAVPSSCCQKEASDSGASVASASTCCGGEEGEPCAGPSRWRALLARAAHQGLVVLPQDLGLWILAGIALGGLLAALVPMNAWSGVMAYPALAYLGVMVTAVPLYVCATGSIPLAFGLLHAGFSPGAALVFLIAGPATNTATIATLYKTLGRTETALYLGALILVAWGSGWAFDAWVNSSMTIDPGHSHAEATAWWMHLSAAVLVALLVNALIVSRLRRKQATPPEEAACAASD